MATKHPRYLLTDTGDVARAIDVAAQRWPELQDRRALLRRLLADTADTAERASRTERQRQAAGTLAQLVDADVLLSDQSWR